MLSLDSNALSTSDPTAHVEKAIANLKRAKVLRPDALWRLRRTRLASAIRPAGYYTIKAVRLKNFLRYFRTAYAGSTARMAKRTTQALRAELLAVNGIGPETADSILLYALHRPVFVVDAYTKRALTRHKFVGDTAGYDEIQQIFMRSLKADARLFNEFHALLVRLGKEYCRKNKPRCQQCPLSTL